MRALSGDFGAQFTSDQLRAIVQRWVEAFKLHMPPLI
jgi:hypothetical protein